MNGFYFEEVYVVIGIIYNRKESIALFGELVQTMFGGDSWRGLFAHTCDRKK